MALNIFTNGTAADADEVNENFVTIHRKNYADNTGGVISSGTETTLATVTIPQDDFGAAFSIVATSGLLYKPNSSSSGRNSVFRLKIDGTTVKTVTLSSPYNTGSALTYFGGTYDSTAANVVVTVTGQLTGTIAGAGTVHGLIVEAIEDNI